jgi:vacuolar-type H+-ATPase subunit E/Vma4
MALPDLIARLEQEAQNRAEAIQREADAQVRAIEADTEQAVQEVTSRQLEHARAERRIGRERERATARRQARAGELEALHTQIRRVLTRARELVPAAAASAPYAAVVPRHLEQALLFVEGVPARTRCQAAFASLVAPIVTRYGAQLVLDENVGPGVVVEAADGSVVVDNTLTSRLARAESRLTIDLARKLRASAATGVSAE